MTPETPARLHGYDVVADLGRHYQLAEVFLVAATGAPPSPALGRAAGHALVAMTTASGPGSAPAHAGALARVTASRPASVIAVAATALAERSQALIARHAGWLAAAADGERPAWTGPSPDETEREAVAALRQQVEACGVLVPALDADPTLTGACLAVLAYAGVGDPEQLAALLVAAQLPAVCAEAFATEVGALRDWPLDVPPHRYAPDETSWDAPS